MRLILGVILAAGLSMAAAAQERVDGLYDASGIPGWVHDAETSEATGAPTFRPVLTDGSVEESASCTLGGGPLQGSAEQWRNYFASRTPQSETEGLQAAGTDVAAVYLVEPIEHAGRPASRVLMIANVDGAPRGFMAVNISGADLLFTITCGAPSHQLLSWLQPFYTFADGVELLNAPAQ